MHLKILLPYGVFADVATVRRIVAETTSGSWGLLPQRLDCVATLRAGILTYETETDGEITIAVEEGILVKAGPLVLVSVRNAVGDAPLGQLREQIRTQGQQRREQETDQRTIMTKLESGFIRHFQQLHHP